MRTEFHAGADDHDRRLESVLRRLLPHQPLGSLHKALRKGDVRLNGSKASPEARVSEGDRIQVWDVMIAPTRSTGALPAAKALPLDWILFEGVDLIAVCKPSGVLVHRGDGGLEDGSSLWLDEMVRAWLSKDSAASLSFRPGPLHRLDRETSGIVVFSRTLIGARCFSKALAEQGVKKTYLAVLTGQLDGPVTVDLPLERDGETRKTAVSNEGVAALTSFRPLAQATGLTLAEVDLGTGRTHQIRVHSQSLGHPLAGDGKYGGGRAPEGLGVPWLLHAWTLRCPLLPDLRAPLPRAQRDWVSKTFKFLP